MTDEDDQDEFAHDDYCAVCCPPPDLRDRLDRGKELPFCDSHDANDFSEKLAHEAEIRDEEMERDPRLRRNEEAYARQQDYHEER